MKARIFLAAAIAAAAWLFPQSGAADQTFVLTDVRTQMPVLAARFPDKWIAGGRTLWLQNPAQPFVWKLWSLDPKTGIKAMVVSSMTWGVSGMIAQQQVLCDAQKLAAMLRNSIMQDYLFKNLTLREAHYFDIEPSQQQLLSARIMQARQRGIIPVNTFYKQLVARYETVADGKTLQTFYRIPVLAVESRTAMTACTTIELVSLLSYCAKPGQEAEGVAQMSRTVTSLTMNEGFFQMVNRISNSATASWVAVQTQIRERQFAAQQSARSGGSDVNDRVADMWSNHLKDVDAASNPFTGEKTLVDSRYDRAWINSENEVIYHNGDFNPNESMLFNGSDWRKLK